jgi:hypothetical protein
VPPPAFVVPPPADMPRIGVPAEPCSLMYCASSSTFTLQQGGNSVVVSRPGEKCSLHWQNGEWMLYYADSSLWVCCKAVVQVHAGEAVAKHRRTRTRASHTIW